MKKKIERIDRKIESGFRRIFACIAGIIFCLILSLLLVAYTPLTLPLWPLSSLFLFCLPSIIIGSLLGYYFPKTFGILASILSCIGIGD